MTETKTKPKTLDESDLNSLIMSFKARYGKDSMPPKTAKMWLKKLHHYQTDHVSEAFTQLLGDKSRQFGWKDVITVIRAMYPDEAPTINDVKQWKKNPISQSDFDKRKEMSQVLYGIQRKIEYRRNRGESNDGWRMEYAKHFVRVWGVKEAERQCSANNNLIPDFTDLVNRVIREGVMV